MQKVTDFYKKKTASWSGFLYLISKLIFLQHMLIIFNLETELMF